MMSSDTLSVIKICKGRHSRHEEGLSQYEALKQHYIDVYCIYPDCYEEIGLEAMVKRAFYDLIDHVDKPSNLLRSFEDAMRIYQAMNLKEYDISTASMVSAMSMIQVRANDGSYRNGFDDSILGSVVLGGGI